MRATLLAVHGDRATVRVRAPFTPVTFEVPLTALQVSVKEGPPVIPVTGPRWSRKGRPWRGGRRGGAYVITSVN